MHSIAALLRYFHTLRYLRPSQFTSRICFKLLHPRPDLSPAPVQRVIDGHWVASARRIPSMTGPLSFRFLNEEQTIAGWQDDKIEKLWLYNLHYFDDLNAEDAFARSTWHAALIERWIRDNPPGQGIGWDPYPASLRVVNWVKYALNGNALSGNAIMSLAVTARWIERRIEGHLLGNHLFSNAKALIFAGSYFSGPEAQRWLRKGQAIMRRELAEQILADGGHFERSTMYHALALEDLLDLINLSRAFKGTTEDLQMAQHVEPMLLWLDAMSHPDGQFGFFNDAAFAIAPSNAELVGYASRLGVASNRQTAQGLTELEASGYRRVENGPLVALIDVAPLGPDYLPAHGHADTLSFELSLAGQRMLVNSGTGVYGSSQERLRQRGTAAHNTVVINSRNSSDVWGGFRVARRAKPFDVMHASSLQNVEIGAKHDGYSHLRGHPVHQRLWRFGPDRLVVEDKVEGSFESATAFFHIHPSVQIEPWPLGFTLRVEDGLALHVDFAGGSARLEKSTYHPEFGVSIPNAVIIADLNGPALTTTFSWSSQ